MGSQSIRNLTSAKLARGAPTLRQMVLLSNILVSSNSTTEEEDPSSSSAGLDEQQQAAEEHKRHLEEAWLDGVLEDMIMQEELDEDAEEEENESESENAETEGNGSTEPEAHPRIGGDYVNVSFRHHPLFPWTSDRQRGLIQDSGYLEGSVQVKGKGRENEHIEEVDGTNSFEPFSHESPYLPSNHRGVQVLPRRNAYASTSSLDSGSSLFSLPQLSPPDCASSPRHIPLPDSPPPELTPDNSPPSPENGFSVLCKGVGSSGHWDDQGLSSSDESLQTMSDSLEKDRNPMESLGGCAATILEAKEQEIGSSLFAQALPFHRLATLSPPPRGYYAHLPFRGVQVFEDEDDVSQLSDSGERGRKGRNPEIRGLDMSDLNRRLTARSEPSYPFPIMRNQYPPLPPSPPIFPPPPPPAQSKHYSSQLNVLHYHAFIPPTLEPENSSKRRSASSSRSPRFPRSPSPYPPAPPPAPPLPAFHKTLNFRPAKPPPPPLPPPAPPVYRPPNLSSIPRSSRPPPAPLAPPPPPIPVWTLRGVKRDGLVNVRVRSNERDVAELSSGGTVMEHDGRRLSRASSFYDCTDVGEATLWFLKY